MSVSVKLVGGAQIEGKLLCVDPVSKALVIDRGEGNYTLVNGPHVSEIDGDFTIPAPNVAAMGVSVSNMEKREDAALMAAEKNLGSINKDVSPIHQNLFDKLSFQLPCTWSGTQMVILENIIIDPPYDKAIIHGGTNNQLAYVQKVLAGERRKLGME